MLYLPYFCSFGSAFLVNFKDPNKQLLDMKPVFKFLDHVSSV